jgi:hypothetical protein
VTIGIAKVKVPFSPRCIPRAVWIESFFLKGLPACIHVGNMKDHSPPRDCRTTTLQVDDWRFSIRNAQRRESRIGAAVQEVQPKHILIKTYGALHIGDDEGNRRNLLNERLHNRISVALSQPRTSWNCCSRCTHTSWESRSRYRPIRLVSLLLRPTRGKNCLLQTAECRQIRRSTFGSDSELDCCGSKRYREM